VNGRVRLRPVTSEDVALMAEMFMPAASRELSNSVITPPSAVPASARAAIDDRYQAWWVVMGETDRAGAFVERGIVGCHQLHFWRWEGEIAKWIKPEHRGRGFGMAAQRALLAECFDTLHLNRVESHVHVPNLANQHICTVTMDRVGEYRRGPRWPGDTGGVVELYSLSATDWRERTRA